MEAKPPSYIYFGHYKFVVEYEDQEKTCHYCDETGHLVKECPYKVTKQDAVNESWKAVGETRRTFAGVTFKQMENTPPERYSPSKEDFPELPNNSGALNNRHSTPLAKTKTPKLGTSKGQVDHFDGSIIEFSDEEDSLDDIPKDTLGTNKCPSSEEQKRADKWQRCEDSTLLSTVIPPGQRPKKESFDGEILETDEADVFKPIGKNTPMQAILINHPAISFAQTRRDAEGGDFNIVDDPERDRFPSHKKRKRKSIRTKIELQNFTEAFDLNDPYDPPPTRRYLSAWWVEIKNRIKNLIIEITREIAQENREEETRLKNDYKLVCERLSQAKCNYDDYLAAKKSLTEFKRKAADKKLRKNLQRNLDKPTKKFFQRFVQDRKSTRITEVIDSRGVKHISSIKQIRIHANIEYVIFITVVL
ncbi:unnamed protein product [Clavelina lepadiformis]|uniref:CCHC-type domain-containing protein n=1 Tax=Clavelina lepadiformis TaxID=159417 RepID=A0ABP0G233_CLALP